MKRSINNYIKYFLLSLAVIILIFIAGCDGTPPVVSIINSFLADPLTITVGESSTLSWSVTDATSVTIDQGIGNVALTGTTTVSPATTTTYTLTATNSTGSVTASTTINVNPVAPTAPIINSFLADPTTITLGESSTLSWGVTDATSVTIDNGIGSVALTGTTAINPITTTTYSLTATNAAGSVTGSVTVIVGAAYGSIDINSTPTGAKVYLDGVDTGSVTPYAITHVEAGIHTIKLDKYHCKIQENTNVSVNAGETTYLNWSLTYASTQYILLQPGSEGKDSYIISTYPDDNYGILHHLYVGTFYGFGYHRAYLQFNLSAIPADARITDADLKLYQYHSIGSENFQIGLYKVTSNWEENTITCNLQPANSSETEALCTVYTGSTTWRSWGIDDLVQGWIDGSITNQGMLLKSTDETLSNLGIYFHSSDYSIDTNKRPKLEIDYYIP